MKRGYGSGKTGRPTALSVSPSAERLSKVVKAVPADGTFAIEIGDNIGAGKNGRAARRKVRMDITWVTDRIAVGGGIWNPENMAALARAGITHIIDMQIEFDDTPLARPHGILVCWNPIDDDFEPKAAEVFVRGVEFGLAALKENEAKLFVHCAAGVHRAPMMTLALLGVMGWTLESAMDLIERRRPAADFAEVYVQSVEDFLQGRS
ncbi:MAG: dual specificity protein phosphatase [Candidatus Sulfotelmatobacter sp.]